MPASLVFIIVLATANTVELDGNLGRIRENIVFTQSISLLSLFCVLQNPQCTHIIPRPLSLFLMTGQRIKTSLTRMLHFLGLTTCYEASVGYQDKLRPKGLAFRLKLIRLAYRHFKILVHVFDNVDLGGRGLHKQIHWLQAMLWFGAPPDPDVTFTQTPFNKMTPKHFEKTDDEIKATNSLIKARITKAEIAANDETRNENVEELVYDHDFVLDMIQKVKLEQINTKRGRPTFRKCDVEYDSATGSNRMAKIVGAVKRELITLEEDEEEQSKHMQKILHSYNPPIESATDRNETESRPIFVVEGDEVQVLHKRIDKDYMIAAIMKEGKMGWVPLYCITGDPNHQPPVHRASYLVTPLKVRAEGLERSSRTWILKELSGCHEQVQQQGEICVLLLLLLYSFIFTVFYFINVNSKILTVNKLV